MWDAKMVSSTSSISPPRELCLNSRMYNISGKVRNRCIEGKDRDRDRVL